MSSPLQHFLEHAATRHLPRFDAWFPSTFDWVRLCADVPEMAFPSDRPRSGAKLEGQELEDAARVVFRGAHLLALAVFSARAEGTGDPAQLMDRLATAPDEEEEDAFDDLVEGYLDLVEERVAAEGDAPPASPGVDRAVALFEAVWPPVCHALATDEGRIFEQAGTAADLLWGVARVGAILAVFRWMAMAQQDDAWPDVPTSR